MPLWMRWYLVLQAALRSRMVTVLSPLRMIVRLVKDTFQQGGSAMFDRTAWHGYLSTGTW